MLRTIRDAGMASKVCFAVNFRKSPLIIKSTGIEQTILNQLQSEGYNYPHQRKLFYYNAFLALRSVQGRLILNNELDDLTAEAILEDSAKHFIMLNKVDKNLTEKLIEAKNLGNNSHSEQCSPEEIRQTEAERTQKLDDYISELKQNYLHDNNVLRNSKGSRCSTGSKCA